MSNVWVDFNHRLRCSDASDGSGGLGTILTDVMIQKLSSKIVWRSTVFGMREFARHLLLLENVFLYRILQNGCDNPMSICAIESIYSIRTLVNFCFEFKKQTQGVHWWIPRLSWWIPSFPWWITSNTLPHATKINFI